MLTRNNATNTPAPDSVETARDDAASSRDERGAAGTNGIEAGTNDTAAPPASGRSRPIKLWMVYAAVAVGVAATCAVNAMSIPADLARFRIALPRWMPWVWESTSCAIVLALVPAIHYAVRRSLQWAVHPIALLPIHVGFGLAFSAAHVLGMVALRKLAYALIGAGPYLFDFSAANLFYEARKDLVAYFLIASVFWLAERRQWGAEEDNREAAPATAAAPAQQPPGELCLRDGTTSVRIDPGEIAWVASAGNYVEYCLASGKRHLIRATLASEEERLVPLGLVRVHRTRLVKTRRIKRVTTRPSGSFEVELEPARSSSAAGAIARTSRVLAWAEARVIATRGEASQACRALEIASSPTLPATAPGGPPPAPAVARGLRSRRSSAGGPPRYRSGRTATATA
jgi:LytTr DNA-binding domain